MIKLFSLKSLKVSGKQIVNNIFSSLVFIPSYLLIRSNHIIIGVILSLISFYIYLNLLGWFGRVFWRWD